MRKNNTNINIEKNDIQDAVISALELTLAAQLRAVRSLKAGGIKEIKTKGKSMSHVDMVHDILEDASQPLHINDIINLIQSQS